MMLDDRQKKSPTPRLPGFLAAEQALPGHTDGNPPTASFLRSLRGALRPPGASGSRRRAPRDITHGT